MTLYGRGAQLGGQLRLWARTPQSREFVNSPDWYERQLRRLQVRIARIEGRSVVLTNIYSGIETRIEAVDLLVDWAGNRVVDDLCAAAEASGKVLHLAGDCTSPRQIHMAVAEGAMAARAI